MSSYTLLTGATGLLGSYLLRDLLLDGQRLVVVVRPNTRHSAVQRVEGVLQMWEAQLQQELPRPICLEGDLSRDHLGLDERACQWLAEHCSSVIHSAASLTFHEESNGEPWRTNVDGTQRVLQLCQKTGISQMHYISTAYVCGLRTGRIYENESDLGQDFRNDYEQSKLQAELLVRNADHLDCLTVYRPAVIAGDSQTGYTNTYHGLFMYLQLMCILARNTEPGADGVRNTDLELNISGDEPRNVIPVDWTSRVICHLFSTPKAHRRTFHLAPNTRMTARQMIEAGYTYFNSRGVKFVGPESQVDRSNGGLGQDVFENSGLYRAYEASDPEFDTSNLKQFAGHLPCPEIDEVMLHRFMQFGEKDRWGKRRRPLSKIPFCVGTFLKRLEVDQRQAVPANQSKSEWTLGLDVTGPGGGQWTLTLSDGQLIALKQGVLDNCSSQLKISAAQLAELASTMDLTTPPEIADQRVGMVAQLTQFLGMDLVVEPDCC
ncbi:MAG: SDR family oxidoreductase [Pirellulales bacterium]|nr:SDR family oxidoreductase [Pirellulales bacterium]